ncbi:MAG TPA: Stk1 family PASTA domain-containing Ser/Thr kinase [Solirubrobacteraceae bacterium]|nr:Stk1 family PASTA domain-containing Ser/Thr kinase [Solirubrobacteraceae bacterium]
MTDARIGTETVVDGRYRVTDRLGSGGMADVYCAEDLQLGRNVALKLLHPRFAEDQEFVERFRREASSAAGLQHQNIVSVYDRGEWNGTSYIAMEHVPGRTLKEVVVQEGPLEPNRAIDLVVQVLRAARFAHRRGIIHRDLKPQNVIVEDAGPSRPDETAKVTDFGIARAGGSDMTQTGSIMGTAQYLSPEQAQGTAVDARSDLYSIGVILYELLTGRVPFEGDTAVSIALKQVNEQPLPPSALNPAVTPALDHAVLRALEKDPARRYADADEFIATLEAARPPRDETAPTAVAPATGPMPAVAAVAPAPYVAEEAGAEDQPREDRSRWWWWLLALLLVVGAIVAAVLLLAPDKVTVPTVVGVDRAAAEARLRQDGFSVDIVPRTSDRPKGEVLGQDPAGGTKADKGSTVALTVSDGPELRTVPAVVGLTYKSAANRLRKQGFKPERREQTSDTVEDGRVISSSPPEGTDRPRGETVTLTVSTGPEQVQVPSVVGQNEDDATNTLQGAGFKVSITRRESQDKDPGTVLAQDPAGGSQQAKGATVTLTVAKAPAQVAVPDMRGETEDVAIARLSKEGFEIRRKEQVVDSPEGDGIVIEQDPSGGKADAGSTVTITIGKYEAGSPEPPAATTAPSTTTPTTGGGTTP